MKITEIFNLLNPFISDLRVNSLLTRAKHIDARESMTALQESRPNKGKKAKMKVWSVIPCIGSFSGPVEQNSSRFQGKVQRTRSKWKLQRANLKIQTNSSLFHIFSFQNWFVICGLRHVFHALCQAIFDLFRPGHKTECFYLLDGKSQQNPTLSFMGFPWDSAGSCPSCINTHVEFCRA